MCSPPFGSDFALLEKCVSLASDNNGLVCSTVYVHYYFRSIFYISNLDLTEF